ncbi:MAG: hypothetical protein DMF91_06655 [Acidobacteria bacterium]|nr:MAG: hypothetical protein DMF91_06655 [Acidobacteriota bacterium]
MVTAVPAQLIPAPPITQNEAAAVASSRPQVDAEPSLRAASGSLKSACSHVGWRPPVAASLRSRPAPPLRLAT